MLSETLDGVDVDLRFEDATSADLDDVLGDHEWALVANLPYNVGTPLVLDLLRHEPRITRHVVMLQREAIDRLAAIPGSKTYGLPSVVVALHGRVEIALRVPASVFIPEPKVESAVALITRLTEVGIEAVGDETTPRELALAIVSGTTDLFSFGWVAPAGSGVGVPAVM